MTQLKQWRDEAISKIDSNIYFPIIVIGNKSDLKIDKVISIKGSLSPLKSNKDDESSRSNNNTIKNENNNKSNSSNSDSSSGDNSSSSVGRIGDINDSGDDTESTWTETEDIETKSPPVNKINVLTENFYTIDKNDGEECQLEDSQLTVLQWCRVNNYGHLECSAKDNSNIDVAMETIAALALEAYKTNPKNSKSISKKYKNKRINLDDMYTPTTKSNCSTCGV